MKFRDLVLSSLKETTDWDDPTERYWDRSRPVEVPKIEKEKIYSKPIQPLAKEELVFIKRINKQLFGLQQTNEMYLTNKKDFPYTDNKEKAWKFPLSKAEKFVDDHPKIIQQDPVLKSDQFKYEVHFEIEQI